MLLRHVFYRSVSQFLPNSLFLRFSVDCVNIQKHCESEQSRIASSRVNTLFRLYLVFK